MKLYLATSNLHKIDELRKMASEAALDVEVHTAEAIGGMPEVVEDQDTFSGNALKKARALAALLPSDGIALADDSGICVDALGGNPGIRSARFAGEGASDEANLAKLLEKMEAVPENERGAGFVCHIAAVSPQGEEAVFEGEVRGRILRKRRGENGFGYDPVFLPAGFNVTTAEMSQETKGAISHRGIAMRKCMDWLREKASSGKKSD